MRAHSRLSAFYRPIIILIACMHNPGLKLAAQSKHDVTLDARQTDILKEKTCLLILPASEYKFIDDYKELIPTVWTLTPIEVIKYDNLPAYSGQTDKYAFFQIAGIEATHQPNEDKNSRFKNTNYYLALMLWHQGKKKPERLCRIELYPDFATTDYDFFKKDLNDQVYSRSSFRNFQLPFILTYLKFVEKNIMQQKDPWRFKVYHNDDLMKRLPKDTLYVLDNLLFERNKWNGKEEKMSPSIFTSYGGKYKFVKTEELVSLIRARKDDQPLFLFEYVLSSTDKFIGVLEINSGTIAYRNYVPVSYNLKPKDLEKILE